MKQKKIISLPSNEAKIYRQILAFMNFMLDLTIQERNVLAEIIKLDNEYEALPEDKRGKFILSTDMRKEIRTYLQIEEKQFNVILSRLKSDKKGLMGKPLIDSNNVLNPELRFKPDSEGFRIEVNLVMTTVPKKEQGQNFNESLNKEIINKFEEETEKFVFPENNTPPTEYKYDASKAPIIEEENFDITLDM